jgi:hypothetical protein
MDTTTLNNKPAPKKKAQAKKQAGNHNKRANTP